MFRLVRTGAVMGCAWVLMLSAAWAAEVSEAEVAAPAEVSDAIKATLSDKALVIKDGDAPIFEFWFSKAIPASTAGGKAEGAIEDIKELTLLGVVRVGEGQRDFKDSQIDPGVYTMRLGKLPQNVDHMGVAPFPSFAVLIPADVDTDVKGPSSHDDMADKSMENTVDHHPNVLSLQPVEAVEGDLPQIAEGENEWQILYVTLPCKSGDAEVAIKTGVVFQGFGEI